MRPRRRHKIVKKKIAHPTQINPLWDAGKYDTLLGWRESTLDVVPRGKGSDLILRGTDNAVRPPGQQMLTGAMGLSGRD
jgi:hypothetical protein